MVDTTVSWRRRCMFCTALMRKLARLAVPYEQVDTWSGPDADAPVRQTGGGSEAVPTIRVGPQMLTNSSARQVSAAANRVDPGADLPAPGRVPRAVWRLLGGGTGP